MPKLSFIIPTYNAESTIQQCLKSIEEASKYLSYEIIIVDDQSDDDTLKTIAQYASQHKKIRIYQIQHSGVSTARNYGIQKAQGEFIMFVDADDYFATGWAPVVAQAIKVHSDTDYLIFSRSTQTPPANKSMLPELICGFKDTYHMSMPTSKIYKTRVILEKRIHFTEEIINGEDMLFNLTYAYYAKKITFIQNGIYQYITNQSSATHRFNSKFIESDFAFHKHLQHILRLYDKKYKCNLSSFIIHNSILKAHLVLFDRYSYSPKYKYTEIKPFLENPKYQKILYNHNTDVMIFSKIERFMLCLIRKRLYRITYYSFKLKHHLQRKIKPKEILI